jgi:hypothetical protein
LINPQLCSLSQAIMANPLQGLQQRPAAETLEYLGWAATQMVRFSDIPEHAHSAVTATALVDAGEKRLGPCRNLLFDQV